MPCFPGLASRTGEDDRELVVICPAANFAKDRLAPMASSLRGVAVLGKGWSRGGKSYPGATVYKRVDCLTTAEGKAVMTPVL